MENNRTGRNALSLLVAAASGVAAVLAAVVLGGLWLGPAGGSAWLSLLAAAALAAAAVLGVVWLSRARAARRLHAALDAYAEREIARGKARTYPPRGGVLQTHRASSTGPPRR